MTRVHCAQLPLLLLWPLASLADTPPREAIIERIERAYAQVSMFTADSPFTEGLLTSARSANPSAGEEVWATVRPELASAFAAAMTQKGGMLDTTLRASVDSLSDGELRHLAAIYEDPVFRKLQLRLSSVATQREMMKAMWVDTARITEAINTVLSNHGLKEVH